MSKHEKKLKDAFIKELKAPNQYDTLAKKLDIKRSPKHTHYMKKPFFTKPRLMIAMSSFLLLITGFIAFSLISVNAGIPVYKGMEVESITQLSSAYALEEVSEPFIDEIESGLVPETTEGISYYAEQGERILVKVNMENPNNHIILSFTLNGFMYQNLDFNEGPELNGIIQIIVEFRVANASGIQNITIDAIKYIDSEDNNTIKDAIFDADRTIQVGILYDDIPEILEVSETIASTSFTLDFTLTDPSSLSVDTSFLYVFDGTNIMYIQPVSIGINSFVVSALMMGHTYEYAITTLFDPLDGVGARLFVLNQGILETLHGVTPNVTSTQDGVSSTLVTLDGVTITSVSLYLNDIFVSNITETNNAYVLEDLLSNTSYELRTTYTYTFNGSPLSQTSVETFTTAAKDIPTVKVLSAVSFGNLVFSTFRVTDGDDTITDLEVRLYKDGALVQTIDNVTLTPQVANPGTFNASVNLIYSGIGDYLIVVVYTYDLNEGKPLVTIDSLDIDADHTLRYLVAREIPELTLNGDSTVTIEVLSNYTELGATFNDSKDGTGDALISGDKVNTNVVGTYTVLYNYTDTDNNRATQLSRIVNVVDTTPPVITLNGNAEMTIEAGSTYNELGALVTDNYDADDIAIVGGDTVDTTTLGTYTMTYNFTDVNGNEALEVIRTVTVVDTTAPLIVIDGGNTMTLEYLETFVEPTVNVTDNLDDARTITGVGSVDTSTLGTYTLTYNATDIEGNVALEVILTVIVVDTTPPVIILNGDVEITIEAGSTYTDLGAVVTDNYDADDVALIGGDTVDTSSLGTYIVTYNYEDSNGNDAVQVTRIVNITDTTPPVITLNGNAEITIEAGSSYIELGALITDNTTIVGDTIITGSVDTSNLGTYILTYNYSDPSGNDATSLTRTINVIDTTIPVIVVTGGNTITIEYDSSFTLPVVTLTDNYDDDIVITLNGVLSEPILTSVLGTYTVTYNAEDSSGNEAIEVIVSVSVVDTTAPVIDITGGNTFNVEYNAAFNEPTITLKDNYDADLDITGTGVLSSPIDTSVIDAVYTITYSGIDSSGNIATDVVLTIMIVDTTSPSYDDILIQTFQVKSTPIDFKTLVINAADNVTATNDLVITETNDVDFNTVGVYESIITVTDEKGNFLRTTVVVNIVDTTAPVIVITGGNTITLDYLEDFDEPEVTLTDNYDDNRSLKGLGNLSTTIDNSNVGSDYTITYDAQDSSGNLAATVVLTIQIRDLSAPTFDTIIDKTIEAGTSDIDWITRMVNVIDTYDDAMNITVTLTEVTDNVIYNVVGTYTVTVKATDSSGNETSQTFNVTVEDTTVPVISLTGSASISVEAGTSFTDPGVVITDNVAVGNVVIGGDIVDVNTPGTYVITYNYSDPSSNAATQVSRTVVVEDNTKPVITLNGESTITLNVGDTYSELGADVTDNIYPDDVAVITGSVDTSIAGTYTLNYDYTDGSGNVALTVSRTVIVVDGSQSSPYQIRTVSEFQTYFSWTNPSPLNVSSSYFKLMNNLDFTGEAPMSYYLDAHLNGQTFKILNAIADSASAFSELGFFYRIDGGSLKNIEFDNVEFNNETNYVSNKTVGLVAGKILNATIQNVIIRNSLLVMNTQSTGLSHMGLLAGTFSNVNIDNVDIIDNQVEFRATTSSTSYYGISLFLGTNSLSNNTSVINDVLISKNELYHSDGDNSTNTPAIVIANPSFRTLNNASLTISNIREELSEFYLATTSFNNRFRYGYYAYFNSNFNLQNVIQSNINGTESVDINQLSDYSRN
jgi:hypothetical protein